MKITILEDDSTLAYALNTYFYRKGYEVISHSNLSSALNSQINEGFHLIDINLPDGEGFKYGEKVSNYANCYIIYLTVKDDQNSVLKGFDFGADDYITKPFTFEELNKRMEAISKRVKPKKLTLGNLVLDVDRALVTYDDQEITLSVQEYRILLLLLKNKYEIVSRDLIHKELNIIDLQENTLNVAIARLRKKLQNIANIETIVKKGYRINL